MDKIIESLQPLFDKARAEGLWFLCTYEGLWFSPDELEALQKKGQFVWGPVNWRLTTPIVRLKELEREAESAAALADDFRKRLQ